MSAEESRASATYSFPLFFLVVSQLELQPRGIRAVLRGMRNVKRVLKERDLKGLFNDQP